MADLCRIIDARISDPFEFLRSRTLRQDLELEGIVRAIIDDVRQRGDIALLESARRFDSPAIQSILVTDEELEKNELPTHYASAIEFAAERIERFHTLQLTSFSSGLEAEGNAFGWRHEGLGQRVLPMQSAGVYVPGGKATYPSSVLMNAIPAKVAGVEHRFVTTPCNKDGKLAPVVLHALKVAGVERAFKVGGAAAIAALALGTESVPRVDKIVGPGNRFVNEAKRQLWGQVGLDGYAGPSEVCVLLDESANIEYACADLLTQIEHSDDNAAFIVSTSERAIKLMLDAAERQLNGTTCEHSMRKALSEMSCAFIATDLNQAVEIVNAIAPEHLSIALENPDKVLDSIRNAGAVLIGEFTPESAGDYVLGPSHTLPTAGAARFGSPVNVMDFLKIQSYSHIAYDQLLELIPTIEAFGEMEGFPVHARGASIRLSR